MARAQTTSLLLLLPSLLCVQAFPLSSDQSSDDSAKHVATEMEETGEVAKLKGVDHSSIDDNSIVVEEKHVLKDEQIDESCKEVVEEELKVEVEELEEIWDDEHVEDDDLNRELLPEIDSYDRFKSKNIYDKHESAHADDDKLLSDKIKSAYELPQYYTLGLIMMVVTLLCSAVAYKLAKKTRRRTATLVSQVSLILSCHGREVMCFMVLQVMAKDLGYTQLDTNDMEEDNMQNLSQFRDMYKIK